MTSLAKSDGWQIIRAQMEVELDIIIGRLSSSPELSESSLHHMRGLIYAAKKMLDLPEAVAQQINNSIILNTPAPAKAGTKGKSNAPTSK